MSGIWLRKYLLDATPNDATSPVSAQYARVVQHIASSRADGSVTRQITDGDIYLNAVFTAEAIKEGVGCDEDSQGDWSQASVLLKVYHLWFQTEEREFVLFVTEFNLETILDRSSFSKLSPVSYLKCPEVRRKYENHCRQLRLADGGIASDCSLPASLLLTQMSAEGENQISSVASRVHSGCVTSDPNHMRPLDLDHFLIGLEDQIKLQSIEEWLSDYIPPSNLETFPSACSSVAMPTHDTVQSAPPSSVRFCSVGIQVSLDHHPVRRPFVANVGVAVGNSLLFGSSQECRFPPRTDTVRETFSSSGSGFCLDEALEALAQPVLSSESSENMSMEPVSQISGNSVERELTFSLLHSGHLEALKNISAFVEPVQQSKMNADQTVAQTKNVMQSDHPYQSTQIDYLSSQHVLMEPCFPPSPLPFSRKKKSSCPADSLPLINSENLSDGRILSVPVRESSSQNSEKGMDEKTAKSQDCSFRSDRGSDNFEKISANAKMNMLDQQACADVEPVDKAYDNGGLVVNRNFTAASESLSLRNCGAENQKPVYSFRPSFFKNRTTTSELQRCRTMSSSVDHHMSSSLAQPLNQDVRHLEPLSGRSWLDVLSQKATEGHCRSSDFFTSIETRASEIPISRSDGITQSGKCNGLRDPISMDNQREERENISSGSRTLVCESRESQRCRSSMLLPENEDSNARCLDPLSAVSSKSFASMPSSSSCVGQHNRFGERISNSGALTTITYCNRTASSQQLGALKTTLTKNSNQVRMSGVCASATADNRALKSDSSAKLISSGHRYNRSLAEKESDPDLDDYDEFLLSSAATSSQKELGPAIGSSLPVSNKNVAGGVDPLDRQEECIFLSGDEELEDCPAPKQLKIDGKGNKQKKLKVKSRLLRSESKNPEALFRHVGHGKVVVGRKRKLFTGDHVLDKSVEKSKRKEVLDGGEDFTVPKDVASLDKLQRREEETTVPETSGVRASINAEVNFPTGGKLTSNQCPASKDVEGYRTKLCTDKVTVAAKLGKKLKLKRTLKEREIASKTLEINLVKNRVGGFSEKRNDVKKSYDKKIEERVIRDNAPSASNFMSRTEIDHKTIKRRPQYLLSVSSNESDADDVEADGLDMKVLKMNRDLSLNTSGHCPANQSRSKPSHSKYHMLSSFGAADLIQEKALHNIKSTTASCAAGGDRSSEDLVRNGQTNHVSSKLAHPRHEQSSVTRNQSMPCLSNASVASSQGTKSSDELQRFGSGRLTLPTPKNSFPSHQPLRETVGHGGEQPSLDRGIQSSGLIRDRLKVLLGRDQMTAEQAGLLAHSNFPDDLKWRAYNYCKNLLSVSKHRDC